MGKDNTEELRKYIIELAKGKSTRELFDNYSSVLKTCTAAEVNSAIDFYMAEETDFDRIEKTVAKLIRACGNGLEDSNRDGITAEPGFIRLLKAENRRFEELRIETTAAYKKFAGAQRSARNESKLQVPADIIRLIKQMNGIRNHYQKLQNELFSQAERYLDNINCVKLMWHIQDKILADLKALINIAEDGSFDFGEFNRIYGRMFINSGSLIFREEKILFPVITAAIPEDAFDEINGGLGEYETAFGIDSSAFPQGESSAAEKLPLTDTVALDTGELTPFQINLILKNLPFDITFVDENDNVRYFSRGNERIFPRSPGIIGRPVRNCHPPKSVHIVQKIVDDFKSCKRKDAEFWIQTGGRFIHIRYFPLFEGEKYRGVVEVSQDVGEIMNLSGEKRLLDEE